MASGNKNLRHLVGRKLVPFFVEDDGELHENVDKELGMSKNLDFSKDTGGIEVRRWTESGLFEDPKRLDGAPTPSKQKRSSNEAVARSSRKSNQRRDSGEKRTPSAPPKSRGNSKDPENGGEVWGTKAYAMAEFQVPPDAKDIPLPSFVLTRLKAKGVSFNGPAAASPRKQNNKPKRRQASPGSKRRQAAAAAAATAGEGERDARGATSATPARNENSRPKKQRQPRPSNVAAAEKKTTMINSKDKKSATKNKPPSPVYATQLEAQPALPQLPPSSGRNAEAAGSIDNDSGVDEEDLDDMICLTEGGLPDSFMRLDNNNNHAAAPDIAGASVEVSVSVDPPPDPAIVQGPQTPGRVVEDASASGAAVERDDDDDDDDDDDALPVARELKVENAKVERKKEVKETKTTGHFARLFGGMFG